MKSSVEAPPPVGWKGIAGALIRVLDKGLDILVPLGMLLIGMLQIFPEYRLKASSADSVVDMSSGMIFIQPLFLFSLSLAAKLFKSANLFPVNHWGFLVGFIASVSSALLVPLIAVTERVDVFWFNIPILLIWLLLLYESSIKLSYFAKIKKCVYALFVTSLLIMAFLFSFLFGVKYEMKSIVGAGIVKDIKELDFPDNNHCFRTTVDAEANSLGYLLKAGEEFDQTCSAVDAAKFLIDTGLKNDNVFFTVWGMETLKHIFSVHKETEDKLEEILIHAQARNRKSCIEDKVYTLCIKSN
jgi:hypothetical protein